MVRMAAQEITLTLKAGTLMSKNHIKPDSGYTFFRKASTRAFTFVEVIIALAIVSISLLGLIRLHIININMTEAAEITSQAVLLAEEKIAETLAAGYPNQASNRGTVQKNALCFDWQTEVTDLHLPQLDQADISRLRKISVDINWKQGIRQKSLRMSTYIADRKLQ